MKKNNNISILVILLLPFFLLTSTFSFGKERKWEMPISLTGSPSSLTGSTYMFMDPELGSTNYVSTSNKIFVELKIDDFIGPYFWYEAEFKLDVTPILANGSLGSTYTVNLKVVSNHYGGFIPVIDLDKHLVNNQNARGVQIKIVGVSIVNQENLQVLNYFPQNLKLTASIETTRYYNLSVFSVPIINISQNTLDNTIDFSWNAIAEAEEYELEWTWVDNYTDSNLDDVLLSSNIPFTLKDFSVNSTRIQTQNNTYSIANIYDRGYLIYRIRAVGRFTSDPGNNGYSLAQITSHNFYTYWSGINSSPEFVSNWNHLLLDSHQKNMNWQFQTSYAEEGKKKDVVSYFDGSLRNRQTVTKINTNDKAIIGEIIYDNEGRAAVEVLPAPVNSSTISYYPNFNKNTNDKVYSYQDFVPLITGDCTFETLGMSTSSGASNYYSDVPGQQSNYQDFVPQAMEFPFSQIQYSNDNTGRVKRKGGVGVDFQLDKGHEMKYFYSVPSPEELNRLFGYYVGNALHYKKNAVIDPNGQLSVTYLDPQGRTIATALAADSPEGMQDLNDPDGTRADFLEDLLNKLNPNDHDTDLDNNIKYRTGTFGNLYDGLRYDAQKVFTNSNQDYNFAYNLNNGSTFNFGCDNINPSFQVLYPFVYNLLIDVKDECGRSQLANHQPITRVFGSYTTDADGTVTSINNPGSISEAFTINPPIGVYSVNKNLTVDPVAVEIFAEDYLKKAIANGCIFPQQNAVASAVGCFNSCEECAQYYSDMSYNNGTLHTGQAAYVNQMIDTNSDLAVLTPNTSDYNSLRNMLVERYEREWDLLIEECLRPCNGAGITTGSNNPNSSIACSSLFGQIIADIMPGGQYADTQNTVDADGNIVDNPTPIDIDTLPLSVYNETITNKIVAIVAGFSAPVAAGTQNNNNWRHPSYYNKNNFTIPVNGFNHYFDENGQIDYVVLTENESGVYAPEILPTAVGNVISSNGALKIEPQYLKNVEDFLTIMQSKPSWALSLIKYHPEFHYINYQLKYCESGADGILGTVSFDLDDSVPGDESYNVNSDGYDTLLGSVSTFDKAFAAGFFDTETTLLDNDPFFHKRHPLDGFTSTISGNNVVENPSTVTLRDEYLGVKLSIMQQALKKGPSSPCVGNDCLGYAVGIGEPNVTIARSAFEIIKCTGIGMDQSVCAGILPLNTTFSEIITKVQNDFDAEEKNRFWYNYLSNYTSLKQKIKDVFINLHALRNGGFNDCIGNLNGANINVVTNGILSRYPDEVNYINSQISSAPIVTPNNCSANSADLASKRKRFIIQENIATNDSSGSAPPLGQLNTSYFTETGICPMIRDLELFLDKSVNKVGFAPVYRGLTPNPQPNINYITLDLLAEMGGNYISALAVSGTIDPSSSNKAVTLNFVQNASNLKSIKLTIPNTPNNAALNWNTYYNTGSWKIVKMSNTAYTNYDIATQKYNFKVLAKITTDNGVTFFERVLDGETKIRLTCTTGAPADGNPIVLEPLESDCNKKELFANDLRQIIHSMSNSQFFATASSGGHTVTLTPFLRTYFGVANSTYTAKWMSVAMGLGGPTKFKLSVKSGSNIDTGVVITRNSETTSYSMSSSAPYNLTIGNIDEVEDIHTISIDLGSADFNGFIQRYSPDPTKKIRMYFTCCSECGEYDFDGDGIGDDGVFNLAHCDFCDNRIDANNDGVSDCPECTNPADVDCDGILNGDDNCPYTYNPLQEDNDNDGFGDACDYCPSLFNTKNEDADGDGVGDDCDNCKLVPNSNQSNVDGDQYGDVCDPGCFINDDKTVFEETFRDLLQATIDNGVVNLNFGNATNLPAHITFYNDYQLQNRATNNFSINNFCGSGIGSFDGYDLNNIIFTYQRNTYKFPKTLRWRSASSSFIDDFEYFQFELNESGSLLLGGTITQITGVTLLEPTPTNQYGLQITGTYLDNGVPESFTITTQLRIKVKKPNVSTLCVFDLPLCQFVANCNNCRPVADQSKRLTNYQYSSMATAQNTCPCIPQPVVPVGCEEAYLSYMSFMQSTFTNPVDYEIVSYFAEKKDFFCNQNLQYLVQGYIQYISTLQITSSSHPQYISIGTFGLTGLNYGYDSYQVVINSYDYYLDHTTDIELKDWNEFVSGYLLENHDICPPAPMTPSQIIFVPLPETTACEDLALYVAEVYNSENYLAYLNLKKQEFKIAYLKAALETLEEDFTLSYKDKEYQYTLYYYDQAGNLTQTVAPQGVVTLPSSLNQNINQVRNENDVFNEYNNLLPQNKFKTLYRYNSLNQLVWQSTPDGGVTRFAYDSLGRIVASQNAKQISSRTILNPSLTLGPELQTKENGIIINERGGGDFKDCVGYALDEINEYGYAEHTLLRTDEEIDFNKVMAKQVFGLTYDNKRVDGKVDYGFYFNDEGQFQIETKNQKYEIFYPAALNDILKIERDNGYVNFYQNDVLLKQVVDTDIKSSLYLNFYMPTKHSELHDLRIAISSAIRNFSYTCYDELGRIKEAGQFKSNTFLSINDNGKLIYFGGTWVPVSAVDDNYPHNVSDEQIEVSKTLYDSYAPFNPNNYLTPVSIRNTRNRVTAILTFDHTGLNTPPLTDNETAIFYNYDIHGNVDEMVQRISPNIVYDINQPNGVLKRVNYEYDLISGNVNKVIYQKDDKNDQFIHKYNYDADNRITSVETSRDNIIWEKDASYEYLDHGPLARVVTGDKKVQGTDYAYTLQGWLKTVNSENLSNINKDMGRDGSYVSKDAFGFSLSYFDGDYKARHLGTNEGYFISTTPNNNTLTSNNLYNGNINRMITSVRGLNEEILPTQVNLYTYDQLNRIFEMNTFKGIQEGSSFVSQASYRSGYSYDKNGNLDRLQRDAPKLMVANDPTSEQIVPMDRFRYHYTLNKNRLAYIEEEGGDVLSNEFDTDIDNQPLNNYKYDQIGQLISDTAENLTKIDWRVDGKVKSINKNDGNQFINFFYDGLGNRVAKQVTSETVGTTTSHYARDAQGNTMAVYKFGINNITLKEGGEPVIGEVEYKLQEHHIYGSSRLGIQDYEIYQPQATDYFRRLVGDKKYELSNHLGNVLSVITDRKIISQELDIILIDNFDDEIIGWHPRNQSSLGINKDRELQITVKDSTTQPAGIERKLTFEDNKEIVFSMFVKRLEYASSAEIKFEVWDNAKQNILWSTNVPADGLVTGAFTPSIKSDYFVCLSISNPDNVVAEFSLDNFYAYARPITPIDYVSLFLPDVVSYNDYYPFGSLVPNRHDSTDSYRYGFQGQEKDDEIKGEGNSLNYTFRMHDPRAGRFFAIDPLAPKYPHNSPYAFSENRVIDAVELEGLETGLTNKLDFGIDTVQKTHNFNNVIKENKVVVLTVCGIGGGAAAISAFGIVAVGTYIAEEGAEYAFEELTGVPIILDPVDALEQIMKKGGKRFAKDVVVEGRKFAAGTSMKQIKSWAYNVKTYGRVAADAISKGKISIKQFNKVISTPFVKARQSRTKKAIEAFGDVNEGATLYRIGTKGKSMTGENAQFWALEDPRINPKAFAEKYNIPEENIINADFIETATVPKGGSFITREAGKASGSANKGSGIEVVVPKGGTTGNKIIDL